MSRTKVKPANKKAIQCPDCGYWVTLQGYGGHRRFYHGEYQKDLKRRLFNRLIALRQAGKVPINTETNEMLRSLGGFSKTTMEEILEIRDFIESFH